MRNMKFWRTALVATLVLTVMLSVTGGTIAWFTDTVTSGENKIQAGNLDVDLFMYDGTKYVEITDKSAPIFGTGSIAQNNNAETLWEPGKTQVAYLKLVNNGNLALKYQVSLNVMDGTTPLSGAMLYTITPDAQNGTVKEWNAANAQKVVAGEQKVSGEVPMAAEAEHYFALSIHMDEAAGNEYQGGSVTFDITVNATQDDVEADSFGTDYDAAAKMPGSSAVAWYDVYTVKEGDDILITSGTAEEYVEIAHQGGDLTIKNVTFKNGMTIYTNEVDNDGTVTMKNCTIYLNDGTGDPAYPSRTQHKANYGLNLNLVNGSDMTFVFKDCKFVAAEDYVYSGQNSYNVYIGGGYSAESITFDGCEFSGSGKHGIGCSSEDKSQYYKLTVTGCKFFDWNNDPAIANGAAIRGNLPGAEFAADITITGNTFGNNNNSSQSTVAIDSWTGSWN